MKKEKKRGLPLPSILTLIFVVLKLVGVIDWNWLVVVSPNLIAMAIMVAIMILKK